MTQLAPAPVTQPNPTRRSAKGSVLLKMLRTTGVLTVSAPHCQPIDVEVWRCQCW